MADYLEVPVDTCVFVPNVSMSVDIILRNLVFSPGDVVVCFADVYPAWTNTLSYLTSIWPVEVRKIEYTHPVSDDYICSAFEHTIGDLRGQGKCPRLALFDTISSLPGARMPFERLTKLCKTLGVLSLVDGAHGIGHIPLDILDLDPDFFVSNLHKWLYVPRSCAVLYVPERMQHLIVSTIPTSFGHGKGFVQDFSDLGTLDNSAYLSVHAALAWRKRVVWNNLRGEEAIFKYCSQLAREGGKIVADILGTTVLENEEKSLRNCNLINVRMPLTIASVVGDRQDAAAKAEQWMMKTMMAEHNTAVYFFTYDGYWWARLSAQVYLARRDFELAAQSMKQVCEQLSQGEWKA